jgi:hypothetical protein
MERVYFCGFGNMEFGFFIWIVWVFGLGLDFGFINLAFFSHLFK